jgi:hypothetical protein
MNLLNKPKVFLSHSAKDKKFIERVASDLRRCNIEPWLYNYEIRGGKPWLKVIFSDGLPACDCILIYLTENSIDSKMVQKEIDAAIIQQLEDEGISLLPYVSNAALRPKLRNDLRALFCREWDSKNYVEILPEVIADIWHSYVERAVKYSSMKEKVEKQSIEKKYIELKSKSSTTPFSKAQLQDFQYIYDALNKDLFFTLDFFKKRHSWPDLPLRKQNYKVSFIQLLYRFVQRGNRLYSYYEFESFSKQCIFENLSVKCKKNEELEIRKIEPSYETDLLTFGLVTTSRHAEKEFTAKIFRFIYWFGYNKLNENKLLISIDNK